MAGKKVFLAMKCAPSLLGSSSGIRWFAGPHSTVCGADSSLSSKHDSAALGGGWSVSWISNAGYASLYLYMHAGLRRTASPFKGGETKPSPWHAETHQAFLETAGKKGFDLQPQKGIQYAHCTEAYRPQREIRPRFVGS